MLVQTANILKVALLKLRQVNHEVLNVRYCMNCFEYLRWVAVLEQDCKINVKPLKKRDVGCAGTADKLLSKVEKWDIF